MATEVLRRRGTTLEHSTFTGGVGETTIDLDKDTVVVHDGSTAGGFPLLREDFSNAVWTTPDSRYLLESNNLSDLTSASSARGNIGLGSSDSPTFGGITVNGATLFDIGINEFRIQNGSAIFVGDGSTGQVALGAEPVDDVGLLLDTPARAVTDNTNYDRLKVTNSGQLTISANTTSPIVATAQFDEPNINLASGAAVTNAATVYIEGAPTEGDSNYALYAPSGDTLLATATISGALTVDGGLFAKEFVVAQTRMMTNFLMGPFGGSIESVSGSAGSETITVSDEFSGANPLNAGAIILIQERTGQSFGTIIKKLIRKVASVSGMDATLTTTGITWTTTNDTGAIEAGDHFAPYGHTTDATLDHWIQFDTAGVTIPAMRIFDEVTDVGGGFEPLRVGGLSGFDASITGDVGIAGATKADGAVFWITEDEANLGGWAITGDYIRQRISDSFVTVSSKNLTGSSTADFRLPLGFSIWRNDSDITGGANAFKAFRTGRISAKDDYDDFSGNDWGVQIMRRNSGLDYQDVFRISENDMFFAGAAFDNTDLWGPSSNSKANATVRLDFANGQIYYDAMGGYVYNRIQEAGFSDGDQVASLTDQEWVTGISTTGTASNSANQDKIVFKWTKRFGIDTLRMYYKAKTTESTSGGTATHESRVYFNVEGLADSFDTITNTTYPASPTEKTRDVSSLTDGQTYIVSVNLYSFVDGDDTNSGTDQQSTFTDLQEDVIVIEQTQ